MWQCSQKKCLQEDVQLQVKGKTVTTVSKLFLMCLSDAFRAMFSHNLQENATNTIDFQEACSEETIQFFKEHLYTGVQPLNKAWSVLVELFHLARKYELALLKSDCTTQLVAYVEAMDLATVQKMTTCLNEISKIGADDEESKVFLNELQLKVIAKCLRQQTSSLFSPVDLKIFMDSMESLQGSTSTSKEFLQLRRQILAHYCKKNGIRHQTATLDGFFAFALC